MRFEGIVGFGEVNGEWKSDIRVLRVVIARAPEAPGGFRIVSAYPDGMVK